MSMRVAHWAWLNGSGMARVAETMAASERAIGLDSRVVDVRGDPAKWDEVVDFDVHVLHTHIPDVTRRKFKAGHKFVYVPHGTPEVVFFDAIDDGTHGSYGHADGWQLMQHWLNEADAIVTFWPRHQWIIRGLCQKRTIVECAPLGVDKSFWKSGCSRGKYAGSPSLFTAENCHRIKAPFDLFVAWPEVWRNVNPEAKLHAIYLPTDQHRWFFPLVNANGCSYASFISRQSFNHEELRNAFCSVDYYVGLVAKGDFNRVCLEANACGTKTISYAGNEFSDFWVPEGDQREIAKALTSILKGDMSPREKTPVPDATETAKAMKEIYERTM